MAGLRILIVEDEPLVRVDIEDAIRRAGYEVAGSASSGEEAIAKSLSLHPDIVLMDIALHGEMDGSTAARFIQSELAVPIVFISGQAIAEITDQNAPPTFQVKKPFARPELIGALAAASHHCKRK